MDKTLQAVEERLQRIEQRLAVLEALLAKIEALVKPNPYPGEDISGGGPNP